MWLARKWARQGMLTAKTALVSIDRRDIISVEQTRIVVDKKCMLWNTLENKYNLFDEMPITYASNPEYLQRWILTEMDHIDAKATKGARSSPPVVHMNLTQRSIPLNPQDYNQTIKDEIGIDVAHIVKKKGEYKRQITALESRDARKLGRLPKPPVLGGEEQNTPEPELEEEEPIEIYDGHDEEVDELLQDDEIIDDKAEENDELQSEPAQQPELEPTSEPKPKPKPRKKLVPIAKKSPKPIPKRVKKGDK